ncbi:MAG: PAS domain S-box protein [Burkholderiaceae bacterium]
MDMLSFMGRNGYLPHGVCFAWSPFLLWGMVLADMVIAAAYFSIPLGILVFFRQRPEATFKRVATLFSVFILACGITHLSDVWTIWRPDYVLQVAAKWFTAIFSVITAVAVWRLIPVARTAPRVGELEAAVAELEKEIGRRLTAEERVTDIEQNLALTLASIDAGLITTDLAGNVVRMNEVTERITGWTQAEALGKSYWEVFSRADRPLYPAGQNVVQLMLERGFTVETSHHVVALSRNGHKTPVAVNAALTRFDDGTVRGVLSVIRDMTRVDRAEQGVRRLAAIVESSSDAIIGKTLDGHITAWNKAACEMFGYSADEAIGKSVRMLIPPDRMDEEMDILAKLIDGKGVPPFETVRLAKGARPVNLSISISPIRDEFGRIVGGSKIARDITEQRRTLAALRESEARLRFAFDVARIGDWDLDLASGEIRRSAQHDRCFGYEELQSEWSMAIFLSHVHPQERDDVSMSYRRAILRSEDWDVECRVLWPDGSVHWIHLIGSTRFETGIANHMLGVVSDLTLQRNAEANRAFALRLESENRQIVESNRLKSQFLANMSHELRSPLNAIIGFSDLLCSEGMRVDASKRQQFIGHIRTSGRHLLQLINDVLDLSKVESGKFEFFPEPVDLSAVIAEVNTVLFTQIQRKRQRVSADVDPVVSQVRIDPSRLKQGLYNYLSNAIKFTPDGGLIMVRAIPDSPGFFRIEVEDSGVGIAEVDLPRLFVEFQQLDASYTKRHQGTGLGLALTRRLVEAQGGSVGVRSQQGIGSVFHLRLPTGLADDAAFALPPTTQVLVIEDDPVDRARIVGALEASGHRVDEASNPEEALLRASENRYAGLTLDLMLGASGGLDVLARIRDESASTESPVVALTLGGKSTGRAAFSITDVLMKPPRPNEVIDALRKFGLMLRDDVTVMVIDDDPAAQELMRVELETYGIAASPFLDAREALRQVEQVEPDAIILDLLMPDFNGFEVLDALRRKQKWHDLPVFVWTSMTLTEPEYDFLALAASSVLLKGGGGIESLLERLRRWQPSPASTDGQLA